MLWGSHNYRQHQKCWQHKLSLTWRVVIGCFLLTHSGSCIQMKDAVNYPLAAPDVRLKYMIPRLMDAKTHGALNWKFFSNDEAPLGNAINELQNKTVIQSLALILRESVTLLGMQNMTTHTSINTQLQMISMLAKAMSSSTSELQETMRYSSLKYLSRENLLNRHNNIMLDSDPKTTQAQAIGVHSLAISTLQENYESCQSCQMREKAKLRSLESIKNQILMRLELVRLPNITKPIAVPHSIIEKFYKNFNSTLAGNRRNATFFDVVAGSDVKPKVVDKFSLMYTNTPRHTEKDVPFLMHYSKHARHFQHGQQEHYQYPYNKPKYQTFRIPPNRHSHHHRGIIPKDNNRDALLELSDIEYDQHDDVQNDERQQNSNYQQTFSRIRQKKRVKGEKGQLFNMKESGVVSAVSKDDSYITHYEYTKEIDEEPYSHVNSIYIFPTTSHVRHNRRWEIINFKFEHNHLSIVRTIIHLYIRGYDWTREHFPEILEQKTANGNIKRRRDLIIMIYQVVRRSIHQNLTHTMKLVESSLRIPAGSGQWVQFEIKHMPANWLNQNAASMTLAIKVQEPWMRSFLVIDAEDNQNKQFPLHIEAFIKQPRRRKRSTSLDCQESDHEVRCCRYPLKVNFTNFGWNFVVAPTSFDAYFCNGECKVGYLEQYTHTHIASLTTSATPCCSPTKMSPLSLLYFDQDHNLVLSTIPNMSVEKCSCS
ncbi:PREDICTED: uncharacterized protein LOC108378530 isoform X4 [Rhagoletis zephyria]|nr:PREDICTED: uncharacterized protein LOC108378530 isoform X4 [Rhagoletis zephyria]XP_017490349.1 PREDICTED: uncharacterized protein LOC108378530 isoform X4 [Rhagoletis zephyria]XP_017490357.1 PREDICTED: uncharacterized protein LOC108378530 isoform X4 [Rhagoletis zephyria]XP_017490364.1 PREDICTED: uncharacterized protein LOC108378530 isoform X4 [Rhagoletis zephyria]